MVVMLSTTLPSAYTEEEKADEDCQTADPLP